MKEKGKTERKGSVEKGGLAPGQRGHPQPYLRNSNWED